ncbi:DnaA regulatory inactivator Hda [Pseudazoarcus pumilus]|uniref:DnaA regulatory inactivator Hda n=1 Tax=Pseudazoarcus pumilus TaxID=2067960 RepID=A0A2I6S5B9_9RHOO|nr:DnaA regulatory inactivator Hda [Pseudazoarcus pumilus]AUN94456.1 DnaA regulatory inactivator Hda [Pseudazoarcus pumilus]
MRQLVLDLAPDAPPRFANFIAGDNVELLRALEDCVRGAGHVYLWGEAGSGRSHLLAATVAAALEAGRPAEHVTRVAGTLAQTPGLLLAVDDVDALDEAAQIAVFNAFNRAAALHQTLVVAGSAPPRALALREDLRTRIGQCLVFELRALDDVTRAEILATLAERRGMRLPDDVVRFVLRHGRRDLPSLVATVETLDAASLERKRAVSLALLREVMQPELQPGTAAPQLKD